MASIAGASPTTSATNLSGPTRRRLQELDPEKNLQPEDEEIYEAHDVGSQSHEYHPVGGSIRVLKALFGRKSSSSNNISSSSSKGVSRISKQMWRRSVVLLFLFAMAVVGVLKLSQIGGSLGEKTSFMYNLSVDGKLVKTSKCNNSANLSDCNLVVIYRRRATILFSTGHSSGPQSLVHQQVVMYTPHSRYLRVKESRD